jgi:hypothetical protein
LLRLLLTAKPPKPDRFTRRGHEVSRLEAFSDAVFGFIVTLLVISLDVPNTFPELMDRLSGIASFAVCFALLIHFWVKHYNFFRRYGLHDTMTVIINAALLFVLLLYVYPLKYLFNILSFQLLGLGPQAMIAGTQGMTAYSGRALFTIYGAGFFTVYALFGCLHWHAFRLRDHLKLSPLERIETAGLIAHNFGVASIGLISVALAQVLPPRMMGWAGWIYGAIGPVAALIGWLFGTRYERANK